MNECISLQELQRFGKWTGHAINKYMFTTSSDPKIIIFTQKLFDNIVVVVWNIYCVFDFFFFLQTD